MYQAMEMVQSLQIRRVSSAIFIIYFDLVGGDARFLSVLWCDSKRTI